MRVAELSYELPKELIAQRPPEERDGGRLLVLGEEGGLSDALVRDLSDHIPPAALVVVNDTLVVAARLLGKKAASGGNVELFLLRALDVHADGSRGRYRAMARSSKPLRSGATIEIGSIEATILSERGPGRREVDVELATRDGSSLAAAIDAEGHVPLPPYVDRADDAADRARYQTVYARVPGAVAAPTAGFHLSERVIERLRARGVEIAAVTLHVGLGTFAPVTVDDLDEHDMHEEVFSVGDEVVDAVARARARGAPVVAIGTTVVRALESARDPRRVGLVRPVDGVTKILIQPGYEFSVVDHLLTNFHLPRSTLLALVAAFAGRERVLSAYAHAVNQRYRFFSYGDAMLLSRTPLPRGTGDR